MSEQQRAGLARFKTGRKRMEGEALNNASRLYEQERNKITREYLDKIKGVNAVPQRNMTVRSGL